MVLAAAVFAGVFGLVLSVVGQDRQTRFWGAFATLTAVSLAFGDFLYHAWAG